MFGSSLRMQQSVEMITGDDSAAAVHCTQQGTQPRRSGERETPPTLDGPRRHQVQVYIKGTSLDEDTVPWGNSHRHYLLPYNLELKWIFIWIL